MTSREIVARTVRFEGPERLAYGLPERYGTDFAWTGMRPSPDARPKSGTDEWGCVWENIGVSNLGEVKTHPLKEWSDWNTLAVPDIREPGRWRHLAKAREEAGDKFLLAGGISLYERAHFLRGLENLWCDILVEPENLGRLLDTLVDMNLHAIEQYARAGADGYIWYDDWGLQNRLMIAPDAWRALWKPRYARVYAAARDAGLLTFLHSCGDITSILDDLIEIGLDVIQMDQQENMGLDRLSERFRGRIAFWCPVDIQATMVNGSDDNIRAYCHALAEKLGTPQGGFIAKWYSDPTGAGHRPQAIAAMCEEFLDIAGKQAAGKTNAHIEQQET